MVAAYHFLQASGVHLEVCRMCYRFAGEVYEDGCVLAPERLISKKVSRPILA